MQYGFGNTISSSNRVIKNEIFIESSDYVFISFSYD